MFTELYDSYMTMQLARLSDCSIEVYQSINDVFKNLL